MIRSAVLAAAVLALAPAAHAQTAKIGAMAEPCAALEPRPAAGASADYAAWSARRLAQDYAGHCRYQAENARLAPATAARVVFFGDSITELWSLRDASLFKGDVVNRGISGQTTAQMVGRFQQDVIDLHPRAVHILAGTNDIAGNTGPTSLPWIEANVRSMVELAKAHRIRVVLAGVLPAARYAWRPEIASVAPIAELNAWMKAYAAQAGVIYVDYAPALDDGAHGIKPDLSPDGVHPNAAGYAAMRPIAQTALRQALAGR